MTEPLRFPMPDQVKDLADWTLMTGTMKLRQGVEYYEELGILIVDKDWPEGLFLRKDNGPGDSEVISLKAGSVVAPVFDHGIEVVEVAQCDGFALYSDQHLIIKSHYREAGVLEAFGFKVSQVFSSHTSGVFQRLPDLLAAEAKENEFQFQRWLESRG